MMPDMLGDYFPFELDESLSELGLVGTSVPTALGRVRAFTSAGARITTLFLHGVGMNSASWSPLLRQAESEQINTSGWAFIDLPGFGDSDDLPGPVTLREVSAALCQVLDGLDVETCRLVGHSMGGFLALDAGARIPYRFASVVTVSGAYSSIVDAVNEPARTALRHPMTAGTYAALVGTAHAGKLGSLALQTTASTGILRAALIGVAAHPCAVRSSLLRSIARGHRPRSFRYAQATGLKYDYRSIWSSIEVPVLGLFGDSDNLVSERDARTLAECLPGAVIRVIENAGHFAPMEQPASLVHEIEKWWANVA